jgi:iron complex transport system ATP-binding protein
VKSGDPPRLVAESLTLAYGDFPVARDLSLELADGRITTIIGPNACGKSTLLRALGRLLKPRAGAVYLDGHAIHRLPTKEVAKRLGLLPQQATAPEGITVEDLVRRGRYPHQGFFQPSQRADHEAVERALTLAGVGDLRHRAIDQLSGGQRQRAWMAMALAQDTAVLLLDEPTTYLDIAHQHEILELIRRLNREEDRTVIMVLHDINEAAAMSDRVIAMRDGSLIADGPPSDVVTPARLLDLFGIDCDIIEHPDEHRFVCVPRSRVPLQARPACTGDTPALTAHAVRLRYGSRVVVADLSLDIPAGKITAIIGPNACGKSTLLRSLGRLIQPAAGEVRFQGRNISAFRPRGFAQQVGFLPQAPLPPPDVLVEDLVVSGRYPHQRWYRQWSRADQAAVDGALAATAADEFRHRAAETLSGGQRQRAFLAMTLARQAPVLLLDEPTTFLDISHQIDVLDLVATANQEHGATIVMVLHDLNLAARYAHNVIAMRDGRVVCAGPPAQVVTSELVSEVFGIRATVVPDPRTGRPLVLPRILHERAREHVGVGAGYE